MKYEQNWNLARLGEIAVRTNAYKRAKEKAVGNAIRAFQCSSKPYLAISGGKDSVAMAGIVDQAARASGRDFVLWGHVSDASFPGTEETIIATGERLNRQVILDRSPVSAFDVVGQQSARQFGKQGYFFEAIARFIRSGGYDLAFVGVRAAESARRRKAARVHGDLFHSTVPADCLRSHPILWFRIEHVAAALIDYDLPIHPIYEKVAVNDRNIRLGYVTALDLVNMGTVVFLRVNYPDLYRKLIDAYPEVENYG